LDCARLFAESSRTARRRRRDARLRRRDRSPRVRSRVVARSSVARACAANGSIGSIGRARDRVARRDTDARDERATRARARDERPRRARARRAMRDARATTPRDVELGHRAEASTSDAARDDDATTRDDDDDARDATTRDDDDDARDAASPGRAPIGGINEDGYFGDADGAWLPSDRVPLVLRAREAAMAAGEDYGRDVRTFLGAFGWPIAASAFCVFLLIFALEEFGGAKTRRRGP
jgi:hypothetical protein